MWRVRRDIREERVMTGSGSARSRRLSQRVRSRGGLAALIVIGLAIVRIHAAFPDAHNTPPTGWSGPVFTLSQAYPSTLPPLEPLSKRCLLYTSPSPRDS